ncbi:MULTISPECIES: DUF4998 domain-containing protein [unclassified Caballeronia]|uniref:DUF4998 domain-containing protein n=1 Tax=unclassified Caballeronia TaxID=2646786 RepID=UPI0020283BF3|nr:MULTISPECIES: DUF4998 domain-containing protein [unclassified Caballeronia]MDR5770099.1 DUF4998 domain-containing protein [Caballeronia sp. LZ028]
MINKKMRARGCIAVAVGMLFMSTGAFAQESAYDDLNSCVKKEQVLTTAKGAGLGALAGLSAMLVAHKKEDAGKAALIGAVAGGVAGFATAYYTAVDTCYKKNPSWIPESKLQRTKDFDKVKKEIRYTPKQGPLTKVRSIDVPGAITAGSQPEVTSNFIVMTPRGDDAPITIERKLFVVDGDKPTEVPFQTQNGATQQLTVEPGEQQDTVHVPIPPDAKPGSKFIYQVSVALEGGKADVQQKELTVTQ